MGMPIITGSDVDRSQAITDLIESVALEQAALSHILNAEGEKLQAFVAMIEDETPTITPEQLLEANASVTELVTSVSSLENHLQAKLALFSDSIRTSFYFLKRITPSLDPLPGAGFELLQGGAQMATAISDINGVVYFRNILPGIYTLREVFAPADYEPEIDTTYTVTVLDDSSTTIEGIASELFTVYNRRIPD